MMKRPRTARQLAYDAALFRMGLINSLIREAERLETRAQAIREIAEDLSAPVDLSPEEVR